MRILLHQTTDVISGDIRFHVFLGETLTVSLTGTLSGTLTVALTGTLITHMASLFQPVYNHKIN